MAGESDGPNGATGGGGGGGADTSPAPRPRPSPARLPSIRAPRDLTLASALRPALLHATKSKRVFVPNLDVKREKHDDKGRDHDRRGSRGDRRKDGRGRGGRDGRGRGGRDGADRRRDKPELVQMSGSVFGEGIAAPEKKPSTGGAFGGFGGGGGGGGGGEKDSAMTMPVFSGNKKVDKDEEERKLAALLKDDFVADGEEEEEATGEMAPVRLPLLSSASAASSYVTDDVKVKYDDGDEAEDDNVHSFMNRKLHISDKKIDPELKLAAARRRETDPPVAAMLKDSRKDLIFFQFPDCLPVLTSNDDDGKSQSKKEPSSSSGATGDAKPDPKALNPDLVTFSDLPEGQVGRLQIMKSGKARLLLGDHVLQLEPGTQVKFLQEAASVSTSEDGSRGRVALLGHVKHRVVASPAWDSLIGRGPSS